ncbi:esterase/lipase family protein [Georgenia sp. AZ-5]|uniref:esterase/lipase family protein n=1 Tax=Georgenia sp. AZ-5 TaxID=3367526 RepID=UPI003754CFB0
MRREPGFSLPAWAADYAFAARGLARAGAGWLRRSRPEAFRLEGGASARAPVLLLPGIYESWRFLEPVATHLRAAGHRVHVVSTLGLNWRDVTDGAARAAAYLEQADLSGVVVVAHSKGGLIGKALMRGDGGARVAGMVAVATPWAGSSYAAFFPPWSPVRRLSPRDRGLLALARERDVDDRIVALVPAWDPHIPGGSRLPGARRNVEVAASGHFRVLADPQALAEVARAVAELAPR